MSAAVDALEPEDRALVELYLIRQLGDVEIAELLRVEVVRVTERRQRAFDRLAAAAGADSPGDRAKLIQELRERGAPPPPPSDEDPAPEARPFPWLVVLAGALAAIVALVLALGGGDDDEPGSSAREPEVGAFTRTVALRSPAGGPGRGSARLSQEGERARLSLDVRGLPDPGSDRYALWLYESVSDARRLAVFPSGRFQADVPLPEGYGRYRFVDVSREPRDSNPAHSGESVLRVGLKRLRAPVR